MKECFEQESEGYYLEKDSLEKSPEEIKSDRSVQNLKKVGKRISEIKLKKDISDYGICNIISKDRKNALLLCNKYWHKSPSTYETIINFDLETGKRIGDVLSDVWASKLSKDGKFLFVSNCTKVDKRRVSDFSIIDSIPGCFSTLKLSKDNQFIFLIKDFGLTFLVELRECAALDKICKTMSNVEKVEFSPNSAFAFVIYGDNRLELIRLKDFSVIGNLPGVCFSKFSNDSSCMLVLLENNTQLRKTEDFSLVGSPSSINSPGARCNFSNNSKYVYIFEPFKKLELRETDKFSMVGDVSRNLDEYDPCFSNDSKNLIVAYKDRKIELRKTSDLSLDCEICQNGINAWFVGNDEIVLLYRQSGRVAVERRRNGSFCAIGQPLKDVDCVDNSANGKFLNARFYECREKKLLRTDDRAVVAAGEILLDENIVAFQDHENNLQVFELDSPVEKFAENTKKTNSLEDILVSCDA